MVARPALLYLVSDSFGIFFSLFFLDNIFKGWGFSPVRAGTTLDSPVLMLEEI